MDEPFIMPPRVPTKEEWVPDTKIHRCQVCKEERFNMVCFSTFIKFYLYS